MTHFIKQASVMPIIASSCIATETAENIRRLIRSGIDGVILKTCADYKRTAPTGKREFAVYNGYTYASSPFECEILTVEEELALLASLRSETDILLIPSYTANDLDAQKWRKHCRKLEAGGADAIQLDFFYMGNLIGTPDFESKLTALLMTLNVSISVPVMPKLNINLPKDYIIPLIKDAGTEYVSLLDSVRTPCIYTKNGKAYTDRRLDNETCSCFGSWQLPLTLGYTYTAAKYGLKVCAGGGITCRDDVLRLSEAGASAIQSATLLTKHPLDWQKYLLSSNKPQ